MIEAEGTTVAADDPILREMGLPLITNDGTSHIGLVLNGTVSAGAWTAGALDGLIQALDAWQQAKSEGRRGVPLNSVKIDVLGGTSGGAACAGLFARAATQRFYHIPTDGPIDPTRAGRNPFWRVWVEGLDASLMLETMRIRRSASPANALLSDAPIAAAMKEMTEWSGEEEVERPWLATPLRIVVTQTNLRGIPYRLQLRPADDRTQRSTQFVSHADHAWFVVGASAGRGDEIAVEGLAAIGWSELARHARASAAFPLGFPPVRLSRPRAHYDWRAVMLPSERPNPPSARRLKPDWGALDEEEADPLCTYGAVDGGALNNSPFRLVHDRLAGLGASLPRGSQNAYAAIIVVDPFVPRSRFALQEEGPTLPGAAAAFLSALVAHGRYSSSELLVAADEDVESRHLFTAGRKRADGKEVWGMDALAGSGLGAFFGFLDRSIREHDYLLSKRNMLSWLAKHFVISDSNAVIRTCRPAGAVWCTNQNRDVPIIPVMQELTPRGREPEWPAPRLDVKRLEGASRARIEMVLDHLLRDVTNFSYTIASFAGRFATRAARSKIEEAIEQLCARNRTNGV